MSRRVVITGLGLVTPLGLDTASTWEAIVAGRGGVGPITKFDAAGYPSTIAAEVRGFDPEKFLGRKDVRLLLRSRWPISHGRSAQRRVYGCLALGVVSTTSRRALDGRRDGHGVRKLRSLSVTGSCPNARRKLGPHLPL